MKIIVIIATKNRINLFKKAFLSVMKQSEKPDWIIVVSDSNIKNYRIEEKIIQNTNCVLINNKYTNNYAGSLNTAIDYLIENVVFNWKNIIENYYIAFLDDDDSWNHDYLKKCKLSLKKNTDFVVSGLSFKTDKECLLLSIPKNLSKKSFLVSNPHIQGSNTFIKLETILKAGCFDENLSSTTDRDLFTRVMMLNPNYEIINEYLVEINASNKRKRLTNNKKEKKNSLLKFLSKYESMMSEKERKDFFSKSSRFTNLDLNKLNVFEKKLNSKISQKNDEIFNNRIVFAFISSNYYLGIRLIKEIINLNYKNIKIIVFANFIENSIEYERILINAQIKDFIIFRIHDVQNEFNNHYLHNYLKEYLNNEIISDIAISRVILNLVVKNNTIDGDIIWILDEDMLFSFLKLKQNKFQIEKLNVFSYLNQYKNKADIVVGGYSMDAPIPLLSTLRTSLLDYIYAKVMGKKSNYDYSKYLIDDYYYDLSDLSHQTLETPLPLLRDITINDIFCDKMNSRMLFVHQIKETIPINRGGNTIVYNRKALDMPNISLKINGIIARRGDYFWLKQAKEKGFSIVGSSLATLHNRLKANFNYKKETTKLIKDLIGSSFTKAYTKLTSYSQDKFYDYFVQELKNRFIRYIGSYYRIMGLLQISNDKKYIKNFNKQNLSKLINEIKKFTSKPLVESAINLIFEKIKDFYIQSKINEITEQYKNYKIIGWGNEGIVLTNNKTVIKIFLNPFDHQLLKNNVNNISKSKHFEKIKIIENQTLTITYPYHEFEKYEGSYIIQIVDLLLHLKKHNLVLTNIKKENFIVADGIVKYIDYGRDIVLHSQDLWIKSIQRSYQMLRYPNLSNREFKQLIKKTYSEEVTYLNYGIKNYQLLFEKKIKKKFTMILCVRKY